MLAAPQSYSGRQERAAVINGGPFSVPTRQCEVEPILAFKVTSRKSIIMYRFSVLLKFELGKRLQQNVCAGGNEGHCESASRALQHQTE